MTDPSVACLPVRSPDELRALASVAEAVFPSPRRPAGWFERKLEREGVRPELSVVAVDAGSIQGYLLLGTAPSEPDTARGAGVGLCPAYRGRGIGPRLMKVAANLAREAGLSRLEFLAEPARLPWYTRQGFTVVREELTLLAAPARPDDPVVDWQPATEPDSPGHPSWSWIPAFWQRTPADQRRLLQAEWQGLRLRAWLSREGSAWLVQRLESDAPLDDLDGVDQARAVATLRSIERDDPLLLHPVAANAPWLATLSWPVIQRAFVVRRGL